MPEPYLHINEVAKLLRITPKAIRHYHKLGLVDEPERAPNGYRLYAIVELSAIQQILRLQQLGLSLKQIKFVLDAEDPDGLLKSLLQVNHSAIQTEISRLQEQQTRIEHFLQDAPPDSTLISTLVSADRPSFAIDILRETLAPFSVELADLLIAVEGGALRAIESYPSVAESDARTVEALWRRLATSLATQFRQQDRLLGFWLSRYVALADMPADDRQAQAWLQALQHNPVRSLFVRSFTVMTDSSDGQDPDPRRISRLLPLLIMQQGTESQRRFLSVIMTSQP